MRRIISILMMTLVVVVSYASDIECVGTATQEVQGKDTLFIFRDEIQLHSKVGAVDWYNADGTVYATNTEDIYPDEGCYRVNNEHFCVSRYKDIDDLDFTIEPGCGTTILHLTGDLSASHARTYSLSYTNLSWNGETWTDSAANTQGKLTQTIVMPTALYGATQLRLCYDSDIRSRLGLDSACVQVELPESEVRAVKHQMTSLATARPHDEVHGDNELNRPISQNIITASTTESYSGALEVAFYSNPTPAAQFYNWSIYKESECIATRSDKDIRYTFSAKGLYRVVSSVNNSYCTSDSMEMIVNISESYLRVPNVFTPDGNGQNDEFKVAYRSLREFHIWVYNRWGKLVYQSTNPDDGWDGTINGRQAAEGAYFYVVRAMGTDAPKNAQYIGLKALYKKRKANDDASVFGVYQMSGDINLIRGKK